ncbi:MAG TPA: hypothetical protein VJV78_48960 [Polyangiales bacterium]|nr:hypothetical protein [Polyangiales bacterium]
MDDPSKKRSERERSLEREIREGRKFSLNEAIGREGGAWFKGESAVPRLTQVTAEITNFIDHNVSDVSGALRATLRRRIKANQKLVAEHEAEPIAALRALLIAVLGTETELFELVREVDAQWGQMMLERPHFQEPGQAPHPEDEYTHESVRRELERLLELASG